MLGAWVARCAHRLVGGLIALGRKFCGLIARRCRVARGGRRMGALIARRGARLRALIARRCGRVSAGIAQRRRRLRARVTQPGGGLLARLGMGGLGSDRRGCRQVAAESGVWGRISGPRGDRRIGGHLCKDWAAPAENRSLSAGRLTWSSCSVSHQGYLALLSIERVVAPSLNPRDMTQTRPIGEIRLRPRFGPALRPRPSSCVDMIFPSNHPPCPGLAQCNSCMA